MGNKAVIVGGGPSIKEGIELGLWDKIKGMEVLATNYQFLKIPFTPSLLMWCDFPYWKRIFYHWHYKGNYPKDWYKSKLNNIFENEVKLIGGVKEHDIQEPTINKDTANLELPLEYLYAMHGVTPYFAPRERRKPKEYVAEKKKLGVLPRGKRGLVGTMALSYALLKGYEEVFILGYDLGTKSGEDDKETHFYSEDEIDHWGQGKTDPYYLDDNQKEGKEDYDEMFSDVDMKIWNVSLMSNIETFEKISYEEFFKKIGG